MSLHFDHSVHGGHGPVWALSVSPRVCDRTTGHISTGASWPGVSSQEETQKSAPLLPLVNLPFTGPGTQAQPKASLAVVCPQDKSSGGKAPGMQRTPPTLSAAPLPFCVSGPAALAARLCPSGASPSHKGQTRDLGCWEPPRSSTYLPIQGDDGSDMERRNVGLLQRCRQPLGPMDEALNGPRSFALRNFPSAPSNHPFSRGGS